MANAKKLQLIKEDISRQLRARGKFGKHYDDLINDYIYYVKLKDNLMKDIKSNGLRITVSTGNGHMATKPNESIQNVLKVQTQMLKILSDLGIQEPNIGEATPSDYLPSNQ